MSIPWLPKREAPTQQKIAEMSMEAIKARVETGYYDQGLPVDQEFLDLKYLLAMCDALAERIRRGAILVVKEIEIEA